MEINYEEGKRRRRRRRRFHELHVGTETRKSGDNHEIRETWHISRDATTNRGRESKWAVMYLKYGVP